LSRALSLTAKNAIYAQQTSEVFVQLLKIDHTDLATPIHVCSDARDVISNGITYLPFPFAIVMPEENSETISRVRLRIDNIDRSIVTAVRSISTPASVTFSVVLASSPDTVEAGPFEFSMINVDFNAMTVEGELRFEGNVLNEPFPALTFSPGDFPALF
jgi:hypothetical protein